jgi:hypothetical protein
MPSSASTRLRLELQALGENLNSWGDTRLNEALKRLEEAICDIVPLTVTGNYTLSSSNFVADESRGAVLKLSGSPGATYKLTIPGVEKTYWVYNGSNADQTIGTSGGVAATIRTGRLSFVFCDATDCYVNDPTLDQIKAAAADVSLNSHKLTNVTDPASPQDAATKNYVDVPSANRDMNGKKITTLGTPTVATDATTKAYVDSIAFNGGLPAGSAAGQLIFYNGASGAWTAAPTSAGQFPYFVSGSISFVSAPTASGQVPVWNGSTIAWGTVGAPDYLLQAQGII